MDKILKSDHSDSRLANSTFFTVLIGFLTIQFYNGFEKFLPVLSSTALIIERETSPGVYCFLYKSKSGKELQNSLIDAKDNS